MSDYEQRQQDRKDRYLERADKAESDSQAAFKRSHDATSGIPFGQPILVGHHSEGRHRAALKRSDNAMRKSIEADDKAAYYRGKAAGVGTAGISSDDPDAITKLQAKIDKAEKAQKFMKACNKIIRSNVKDEAKILTLRAEGIGEATAKTMLEPDCHGVAGFAAYQLSNNNGNIRRMRSRIEDLKRKPNQHIEREQAGVKIVHNTEENRIQLFFPSKPSEEVRSSLKSHAFRWSRYHGAWQRQLSANGIYAAEQFMAHYSRDNT